MPVGLMARNSGAFRAPGWWVVQGTASSEGRAILSGVSTHYGGVSRQRIGASGVLPMAVEENWIQ